MENLLSNIAIVLSVIEKKRIVYPNEPQCVCFEKIVRKMSK